MPLEDRVNRNGQPRLTIMRKTKKTLVVPVLPVRNPLAMLGKTIGKAGAHDKNHKAKRRETNVQLQKTSLDWDEEKS